MPVQDSSQAGDIEQPVDGAVDVPEQTPGEGSATEEQQPEQTFTLDQVRQIIRQEVGPLIQSQVAKSENRTEKRIQERFAALEETRAALNLSDEQMEAAQNRIIREEQMNALKPKSPKGNETQPPAADAEAQQVQFMNTVESIFQREGVSLDENSPEWKKYVAPIWNDPNGDPLEALAAVTLAAKEQRERLAALKGNAKARIPGGGIEQNSKSVPYDPNKPASHYLEQAAKESKT